MCGCQLIRLEDVKPVARHKPLKPGDFGGPLKSSPPVPKPLPKGRFFSSGKLPRPRATIEAVATAFRAREAFARVMQLFRQHKIENDDVDQVARAILAVPEMSRDEIAKTLGVSVDQIEELSAGLKAHETALHDALKSLRASEHQLTTIKGIGPKIAKRLREHGVKDLRHLAGMDDAAVEALDRDIDAPTQAKSWRNEAQQILEEP